MITPRRKAFTLVELLVVVSIIALLLGILLPSLSKAREKAKIVVCRTNVRSLGTGFVLYSADNQNRVFPTTTADGAHTLWLDHVGEQISNVDKVRYCPTTEINPNEPQMGKWEPTQVGGSTTTTWIWNFGPDGYEYGSYGFNGWLYNNTNPKWEGYYWDTASPAQASSVPLFTDCRWVDSWPENGDTCSANFDINDSGNLNTMSYMERFLIGRHEGKLNIGFADGHVEDIKLEMLWSVKWGPKFEPQGAQTRTDGTPIYQKPE